MGDVRADPLQVCPPANKRARVERVRGLRFAAGDKDQEAEGFGPILDLPTDPVVTRLVVTYEGSDVALAVRGLAAGREGGAVVVGGVGDDMRLSRLGVVAKGRANLLQQ